MSSPILINLLPFTPRSRTGVFVYALNLVKELSHVGTEHVYWLAVSADMRDYMQDALEGRDNVRFVVFGGKYLLVPRIITKLTGRKFFLDMAIRRRLQAVINRENVRVVFFPSGAMRPYGLKNAASVVTLFDLQFEYFPENFTPRHYRLRREDNYFSAKKADAILAISEFTKKNIVEKYGVDGGRITVTHLAPQTFTEPKSSNFPRRFILYPAALWPHKGHGVLLDSLNILKEKFPDLHVVLTGTEKSGHVLADLRALSESRGISHKVHYLGHVASGTLRAAYEQASALVFPSSFEGFGIPITEAFMLGIPVIAADNTSIPEVVGDAGILVRTGDVEAFASAIERVLTDKKLRSDLVARGYERAKLFSWKKAAMETLEVFQRLCAAN
ncbi:MAG: glycosyltransferase family 4 protein [Candidatus Yanofskybacteria bacterium]|nr:glycosyltransferase family 4 protein [Candidatus Yanofskybacteria bacterium]